MSGSTLRFTLFAIATTVLTVLIAAQITNLQIGDQLEFSGRFDDVTGLRTGDAVRIAGVPVGAVTSIEHDDGQALVGFTVDGDVEVPADSRVEVTWLDLIGARQVDVVPGEADELLADGDVVTDTRSTVDLGALTAQLGPLSEALDPTKFNSLLESVFTILQDNEQVIIQTIADTRALLETVTSRDDAIDSIIGDYSAVVQTFADREQQLRTAVDNLVLVAEAFNSTDAVLASGIEDAAAVGDRVDQFLDANADDVEALIGDLDTLVATFQAESGKVDQLIDTLPGTLDSLFAVGSGGPDIALDNRCVSLTDPPCTGLSAAGDVGPAPVDDPETLAALLAGRVAP